MSTCLMDIYRNVIAEFHIITNHLINQPQHYMSPDNSNYLMLNIIIMRISLYMIQDANTRKFLYALGPQYAL